MLPNNVQHNGNAFCLKHLKPFEQDFVWKCKDNVSATFVVHVRFSNHCVSQEEKGHEPPGAYRFIQKGEVPRVFDEDRYQWSLELPYILSELFKKPTTTVKLTVGNNWYLFRLTMKHPLEKGNKYYCFIRLRYRGPIWGTPNFHRFTLYVESAYSRTTPPDSPHHEKKPMFGKLAEELVIRKK